MIFHRATSLVAALTGDGRSNSGGGGSSSSGGVVTLTAVAAAAAAAATAVTSAAAATRGKTAPHAHSIQEWHFHVYFRLDSAQQIAAARGLRQALVQAVRAREFVVVLNGVDRAVLPALSPESESRVPNFNERPVGPHPQGSFEIWCPSEHLAEVLAWLIVRRGLCTVRTAADSLGVMARCIYMGAPHAMPGSGGCACCLGASRC
eukprot:COSAG01_NODE_20211_length_965_cov_1.411085_1_plen_204_part_10